MYIKGIATRLQTALVTQFWKLKTLELESQLLEGLAHDA